MASYSETELEALRLLRHSFSWNVSMDLRSGVWVATYADERIRRIQPDSPLSLFDALTLAAQARRDDYLLWGDCERTGTEQGDGMACDCCQERLEQLDAVIHEASATMTKSGHIQRFSQNTDWNKAARV